MKALTANAMDAVAPTRVAMVTNIPAPYRLPVFEQVAATPDIEFCAFYCSGREPDREWDLAASKFKKLYLCEKFITFRGRFIHANPDLWGKLHSFRPDVVITTGFNPSHLLAYAYARWHGARHVAMTDGTYQSESKLSFIHRWVRRIVFSGTQAYIGASNGSFELFRSYGIEAKRIFKSHLCANNQAFFDSPSPEKRFDFIFCGRFVAIKNPLFAIEVARDVARRLGRKVSILFVGSGEMEPAMRAAGKAAADEVETVFAGFARQDELPGLYGSARILVFSTQWDPWGVVANEACAAGLPVLVTPIAGSAGELVRDGENGYVLPLDVQAWSAASVRLLSDSILYASMSARSRALVQEYSYENAARGIVAACRVASGQPAGTPCFGGKDYIRPPRVVIIQRRMTHYRIAFFDLLREELAKRQINLTVVFGDPTPAEDTKADSGNLSWGLHVPTRYVLSGRLCWQNASAAIKGANLVVVTQENKLLFNHLLMLKRHGFRLAFWGHGRNFQATHAGSISERLKRWIARRADWWFAYTEASADAVRETGFSADKITVLNNAIDTRALAEDLQSLSPEEIAAARREFGIGPGPLGITLGSLHTDKRLAFLVAAAEKIRSRVPDFQLLVVGDGPDREIIEEAARRAGGRIHCLGARSGREKAVLLGMSNVMLNPGMVGLGVLDAFIAGVPMLTTDCGIHSPEIAYLKSEVNGLVTENSVEAFSAGVIRLLSDEDLYLRLQAGCKESARDITLENMVQRFCDGVEHCLAGSELISQSVITA